MRICIKREEGPPNIHSLKDQHSYFNAFLQSCTILVLTWYLLWLLCVSCWMYISVFQVIRCAMIAGNVYSSQFWISFTNPEYKGGSRHKKWRMVKNISSLNKVFQKLLYTPSHRFSCTSWSSRSALWYACNLAHVTHFVPQWMYIMCRPFTIWW